VKYSTVQEIQAWTRGFGNHQKNILFHVYYPENMEHFKQNIRKNRYSNEIVWQLKGTVGHGIRLGGNPPKIPSVNFFSCDTGLNRALGKSQRGDRFKNYQHFVVLDRRRLEKADIDYVKEICDVEPKYPSSEIPEKDYIRYDNPNRRRGLLEFSHCQVVRLILKNRRKINIPSECILALGSIKYPKYFEKKVEEYNEETERPIRLFRLKG